MTDKSQPKPPPLHGIFTSVPPRYDLINHIITLGMDTRWRRLAVKACLEENPKRFLDIGCGTGDLSLNIAAANETIQVTGLDFSETMLEKAQIKAASRGLEKRVSFVHGEASNIPFTDETFDCVGISFAFRNLTYKNPVRDKHFFEVLRVLKPGGRYVIVESSQPGNNFIRFWHRLYLRFFVGPAGQLISGNKGAYRYLAKSAEDYYTPAEVREMMLKAGFREVRYRELFFGAAGIHVAFR